MLNRFLDLNQKINDFVLRIFPVVMLLINVISLMGGFLYLLYGEASGVWNIYGFFMLLAYTGNILLTALDKELKLLSYTYLAISSVWMLAVMLINTVISSNPINQKSQSTVSAVLLFSLFFLGGLIASNQLMKRKKALNDSKVQEKEEAFDKGKIMIKNIAVILLSAFLYLGLFLAINLLRVEKLLFVEIIVSEYALFFALIFLSIGALIIKLLNKKKFYLYYSVVVTVTIFNSVVFILPFVSIPALQKNARVIYEQAFSNEYLSIADNQPEYFRRITFSLPEYFLGTPSKEYRLVENVLYYQGSKGVDQGLELSFDAYLPVQREELPGNSSVLIRIHGGGWTSGDKGAMNFAQMNKYFANQGYAVFDIQYGLNDKFNWLNTVPIPDSRSGSYTIDDMVRHIGIFTDYLAEHAEEYNADLDSVFISGGSAGGHLTLASGLAITSGKYRNIFHSKLHIKGFIPFYPANGIPTEIGIGGEEALCDPSLLVDSSSPPCLIYQGSHDGLVHRDIAVKCRDSYIEKGNRQCAVIEMPFGGHASDLYFPGYYNQVFLYYMERFMKQYQ